MLAAQGLAESAPVIAIVVGRDRRVRVLSFAASERDESELAPISAAIESTARRLQAELRRT